MQQEIDLRTDSKRAEAILRKVNTNEPSRKDLQAYRALIAENPSKYTELGADFLNSRQIYLNTMNGIEREAIKLRLEEMEKELSAPSDGPMEKLLISHVVTSWLRLQMVERSYSIVMDQSISLTLGAYWEKRLNATQKRFMRATENLMRVRKLMRRSVTVVAVNNSGQMSPEINRRRLGGRA